VYYTIIGAFAVLHNCSSINFALASLVINTIEKW
jgi:hypothetical protein